jgi:hypothetical protein
MQQASNAAVVPQSQPTQYVQPQAPAPQAPAQEGQMLPVYRRGYDPNDVGNLTGGQWDTSKAYGGLSGQGWELDQNELRRMGIDINSLTGNLPQMGMLSL